MAETVQIIFLGHWTHIDRLKALLRKHIPHKIYFVRSVEHLGFDPNVHDFRNDVKKELEKEIPEWVKKRSVDVEMPFFKFEDIFPRILSIISEEKKNGNQVIVNIHGASLMMAVATVMAAGLTDSKVYWILPKKWEVVNPDEKEPVMKPVGAIDFFEIKMPLLPEMPSKEETAVLQHLLKNSGKTKGKLSKISEEIGLGKLGANVKKTSSGVVKLSKTIGKLRENELIETKRIGRKNFEIALTDKGKMMAEVSSLLDNA